MASVDLLSFLQRSPGRVRNVCILAHVDHGKTTLSDSLICSNGIISAKSAGRIRFLDSREDEQARLITMKSSCVTLYYCKRPCQSSLEQETQRQSGEESTPENMYLINLIDSPGHVDFASEVSTAVRLCDGALVVVDAVEGVCPQTRAVLRQAWTERVKTVLVINKLDRLIIDLNMTPEECYKHLKNIIETVNAAMHQLFGEEVMAAAAAEDTPMGRLGDVRRLQRMDSSYPDSSADTSVTSGTDLEFDDVVEESLEFSPSKGNVVFVSAIHGWCLSIDTFSRTLAKKMEIEERAIPKLSKALWGEYYYSSKTKRITRNSKSGKPMFVQFVLDQIWKVYETCMQSPGEESLSRIVSSLKLQECIDRSALRSGGAAAVQAIMSQWLPLSCGVLKLVVTALPSPVEAAPQRLAQFCSLLSRFKSQLPQHVQDLACSLQSCCLQGPVVIHVAKFLGADLPSMRLTGDKLHGAEKPGDFVAFARVFCGTVRSGSFLHICQPSTADRLATDDYRGNSHEYHSADVEGVTASRIFILMGRDLVEVAEASAGSVVAISLIRSRLVDAKIISREKKCCVPNNGQVVTVDEDSGNSGVEDILAWLLSLRDPHFQTQGSGPRSRGPGDRNNLTSLDRCITLSSCSGCPSFEQPYSKVSSGIIRTCIEPHSMRDMEALLRGLALLYKADPSVDVDVLDTGEHVIGCCGEVHLERCLNDLAELYARVPLKGTAQSSLQQSVCKGVAFPPWAGPPSHTQSSSRPESFLHTSKKHVFSPCASPKSADAHSESVESDQKEKMTTPVSDALAFPTCNDNLETALSWKSSNVCDESLSPSKMSVAAAMARAANRYKVPGSSQSSLSSPAKENTGDRRRYSETTRCLLTPDLAKKGAVISWSANHKMALVVRTEPMPDKVLAWLDSISSDFRAMLHQRAPCIRFLSNADFSHHLDPSTGLCSRQRESDVLSSPESADKSSLSTKKGADNVMEESQLREASECRITPNESAPEVLSRCFDNVEQQFKSVWMYGSPHAYPSSQICSGRSDRADPPSTFLDSSKSAEIEVETDTASPRRGFVQSLSIRNAGTQQVDEQKSDTSFHLNPQSAICSTQVHRLQDPPPGNLWGLAVNRGSCSILLCAGSKGNPYNNQSQQSEIPKGVGESQNPLQSSVIVDGSAVSEDGDKNHLSYLDDWRLKHSYEIEPFEVKDSCCIKKLSTGTDVTKWISSIVSGFELAALTGPIAEEPVRGVVFILEILYKKTAPICYPILSAPISNSVVSSHSISTELYCDAESGCIPNYPTSTAAGSSDVLESASPSSPRSSVSHSISNTERCTTTVGGSVPYGPFSGQVMSAMKECCRKAILQRGRCRIFEAMLRLELQCEQEVLGRAYGVLSKRRANIISEELRDGTSIFAIECYVPVSESLGLAQELRSRASGHVSLHLQFSHWRVLDEDPFPEASMTEEELEDEGESGASLCNTARKIINQIRKRKGLATGEKVVVAAEKQRTLTRNK